MALRGVYYLTGSKNDPVCRYYTRAPVGVDAEVVPVDPREPRREVRGVPVDRARGPQLPAQTLNIQHDQVKYGKKWKNTRGNY